MQFWVAGRVVDSFMPNIDFDFILNMFFLDELIGNTDGCPLPIFH